MRAFSGLLATLFLLPLPAAAEFAFSGEVSMGLRFDSSAPQRWSFETTRSLTLLFQNRTDSGLLYGLQVQMGGVGGNTVEGGVLFLQGRHASLAVGSFTGDMHRQYGLHGRTPLTRF